MQSPAAAVRVCQSGVCMGLAIEVETATEVWTTTARPERLRRARSPLLAEAPGAASWARAAPRREPQAARPRRPVGLVVTEEPRLVRGVTARDRVGGSRRLFRPVLGAFSAASLDYDRRGEACGEEDEALLDADGAPR